MIRLFTVFVLVFFSNLEPVSAQTNAADSVAIYALLTEFLEGASRNDYNMHQRMWSDRLIYTSSDGTRRGKAELLNRLRHPSNPDTTLQTRYSADSVEMIMGGGFIVVAFRLVATSADGTVRYYLNTGTFHKEGGAWKAIAWQATHAAM